MKRIIIYLTIFLLLSLSFIYGNPILTLVSPNGGENLTAGTIVPVIWKYTEKSTGGRIILVLYKDGIKFLTISESTTDSGFLFLEHTKKYPDR